MSFFYCTYSLKENRSQAIVSALLWVWARIARPLVCRCKLENRATTTPLLLQGPFGLLVLLLLYYCCTYVCVCCAIRNFQRWQQPEVPLYFCDAPIRTISSLFHDNDGHQQLWDKKTEIFGLFFKFYTHWEFLCGFLDELVLSDSRATYPNVAAWLSLVGRLLVLPASSAVLSLFSV
jgi:hypothetical protein